MTKFFTFPINAQRFEILISYVGSREWWQGIFDVGACIAGGAAMYVADDVQCISNVGDIDVWFPRTVDMTPHVGALCEWLTKNGLDHRIRIQTHIVTVFNPVMNIQFISALYEPNIATLLDGFDYDCVQCAIYLHVDHVLRSGKEITSLQLLLSEYALEAFRSREIKRINLRRWKFAQFASMQNHITNERVKQRDEKMRRKQFYPRGTPNICVEHHTCAREHRIVTQEYWSMMSQTTTDKFEDCSEKISCIHQKKRNLSDVNRYVDDLRCAGHTEDEAAEYFIALLENLKLDEETFKTAKIELTTSRNEWVEAPSFVDRERLALQEVLKQWRNKQYLFSDVHYLPHQYAVRNLALLVDPKQPLESVAASIASDGLKCNNGNSEFSFGMAMDFRMHDLNSVTGLFDFIRRTFL